MEKHIADELCWVSLCVLILDLTSAFLNKVIFFLSRRYFSRGHLLIDIIRE